jgi:hypothetical protein
MKPRDRGQIVTGKFYTCECTHVWWAGVEKSASGLLQVFASGLRGQYFDLVKIQSFASASVVKSPTWESGPTPVFTATNHRPPFVIWGSKDGSGFRAWATFSIRESSVISSPSSRYPPAGGQHRSFPHQLNPLHIAVGTKLLWPSRYWMTTKRCSIAVTVPLSARPSSSKRGRPVSYRMPHPQP